MNNTENFYNRTPKRMILVSFLLAMLLDFIPLSGDLFHWLPEFTALILFFWVINRPQNISIGTAFLIGLLVDIGTAAPLGQHALAYMFSSYLLIRNLRQITLYNYGIQAVSVGIALLTSEIVLTLIRLRFDRQFNGWLAFLSPFIGALLWPLLNKIMVSVQNFRPLRR